MAGYHVWTAGEVVTAANVMSFWMNQVVITCTSGTRPTATHHGMRIYETDTKQDAVYNGTSWVYPFQSVVKMTAAQSVISSTALVDMTSPQLLNLRANERYLINLMAIYDADATADIKFGWTVSGLATWEWFSDGADSAAASGVAAVGRTYQTSGTPSAAGIGAGSNLFANPRGILRMGASDGDVIPRFAQLAAVAVNTRIQPGTTLMAWRLSS
jgi:hypothetical protein